jgi:hypothetical protein
VRPGARAAAVPVIAAVVPGCTVGRELARARRAHRADASTRAVALRRVTRQPPRPGPTPGSGGLRTQETEWVGAGRGVRATSRPVHLLSSTDATGEPLRRPPGGPVPMLMPTANWVFPHVGDMETSASGRPAGGTDYPKLSIRQYLTRPTVMVLWGGQDQGRHDQMCLHTTNSYLHIRWAGYRRRQSGVSGGIVAGWSGDGSWRHGLRQRAIDTSTSGRVWDPRGEHGICSSA